MVYIDEKSFNVSNSECFDKHEIDNDLNPLAILFMKTLIKWREFCLFLNFHAKIIPIEYKQWVEFHHIQ